MKRLLASPAALFVAVLCLLLLVVSLKPYLRASTELVRLRNALVFEAGATDGFNWTPDQLPKGYATDSRVAPGLFDQVLASLPAKMSASDWDRALLIATHLVRHAKYRNAAQSDLAGTYRKILAGSGYCADYTTVFIAIARSAGVFAREWAFSFDAYGGYGHALVEVFDRQSGQWRMLDVFNNFYVEDTATGRPMFALSFREHLAAGTGAPKIHRIGEGRFGFADENELFTYYRRGADQWYLWWGNAVYDYDASVATRLGEVSRAAEQLAAIALVPRRMSFDRSC
ncbi:MAG: transglutaminase-like domain-containing protein, partial [Rubrivivax sp.]